MVLTDDLKELKQRFMNAKTAELEAKALQEEILQTAEDYGADSEIAKRVWTAESMNKLQKLLTLSKRVVEFCQ